MTLRQCLAGCIVLGCVLPSVLSEVPTSAPSNEYRDRKQLFEKIELKLKADADYNVALRGAADGYRATSDAQLLLAYLAMVDGRNAAAIDILNTIAKGGSEKALPGTSIPATLGARFWRLTVYRHSGQVQAAFREIDELRQVQTRKGPEVFAAMVLLYKAELLETLADTDKAVSALEELQKLPKPAANDMGMLLNIYKRWAQYETLRKQQGSVAAQKELRAEKGGSQLNAMAISHHLMVNGILAEPAVGLLEIPGFTDHVLQLTAESNSSRLDRQFCLLLYGGDLLKRGQFVEAGEVLKKLANSDSLLAPDALLMLAGGAVQQGDLTKAATYNAELARRCPKYAR